MTPLTPKVLVDAPTVTMSWLGLGLGLGLGLRLGLWLWSWLWLWLGLGLGWVAAHLVVGQLEALDLARDALAHHALARDRLGHVVDRGRLRLEVLRLGVRLARS